MLYCFCFRLTAGGLAVELGVGSSVLGPSDDKDAGTVAALVLTSAVSELGVVVSLFSTGVDVGASGVLSVGGG